MAKTTYYHEAIIRQDNRGRTIRKIFGSDAKTIDEAARERAEITKKYHRNTLVEITTRSYQS